MARKLTDAKIQEMWELYKTKQSINYVAEKSGISYITVRKYCHKLDWVERLKVIQVKANRKEDTKEVNHRVRHAKIGKLLQAKGVDKIENMERDDIDGRLAKDLIREGVNIEKEALGDVLQTL